MLQGQSFKKISIFKSVSTDPYVNLELEELLLEKVRPNEYFLFFYVNRPSIVMGRFQVPWREINLTKAWENQVSIVRRKSGGGCVYHDLGNLNFCFLATKETYNKKCHFPLLLSPFKNGDVSIEVGDKDDLKYQDFKITGSAFRHARKASYHHGTLLFNTDLSALRSVLRDEQAGWESRGIQSRRARVQNLSQVNPLFSIDWFLSQIEKDLGHSFDKVTVESLSEQSFNLKIDHWKDAKWVYGDSPAFVRTMKFSDGELIISIEKGKWKSLDFSSSEFHPGLVVEIFENLKGEYFELTLLESVLKQYTKDYPALSNQFDQLLKTIKSNCF
jgi:lipoate-protein ligase A